MLLAGQLEGGGVILGPPGVSAGIAGSRNSWKPEGSSVAANAEIDKCRGFTARTALRIWSLRLSVRFFIRCRTLLAFVSVASTLVWTHERCVGLKYWTWR